MNCTCGRTTCFECRPCIEGYWDQLVKEYGEHAHLLEAKETLWEFTDLLAAEDAEDIADTKITDEIYDLKDSW
jgi:hypothetical protein